MYHQSVAQSYRTLTHTVRSGAPCSVDICYQVNCGAHGNCRVSNEARTEHACACAAGWIGAQCDIVDPCYPSCGHGTCVVPAAAARALADPSASLVEGDTGAAADILGLVGCVCEGEYSGKHCEIDPCHDVQCNVGNCQGAYALTRARARALGWF